jgi:hypothetical protein
LQIHALDVGQRHVTFSGEGDQHETAPNGRVISPRGNVSGGSLAGKTGDCLEVRKTRQQIVTVSILSGLDSI